MKVVHSIEETRSIIKEWRKAGLSVGLVPTMGYLHEGHKSLIDRAVKENDKVVVSVFVNPIQFGANEDLSVYPRDIEKDSVLCENAGASIIFNPTPEIMYADNFSTYVDAGEYGVKSEKGFYDYSDGRAKEATKERDEKFLKVYQALYGSK